MSKKKFDFFDYTNNRTHILLTFSSKNILKASSINRLELYFRSGEYLGIAPGGAFESLFGDSNYPVLWGQRAGFARVAIKANKPIIPVFTENIRENTLTLAGRMSVGRSNKVFGISFTDYFSEVCGSPCTRALRCQ